jgi:hypothetical protein
MWCRMVSATHANRLLEDMPFGRRADPLASPTVALRLGTEPEILSPPARPPHWPGRYDHVIRRPALVSGSSALMYLLRPFGLFLSIVRPIGDAPGPPEALAFCCCTGAS